MLKKMLKLVFLMCFTGSLLYAGEVALVTDITGEVTASWFEPAIEGSEEQNTEEQRGRHEWKIEVAEMLQDGTEIRTGAESALTLVHLTDNTEYRLEADSYAKVTTDGIESSACASVPLQLVSTNFQLNSTMQHQVGAVMADREYKTSEESYENYQDQEIDRSGDANKLIVIKKSEILLARPVPPPTPAPSAQAEPMRSREPAKTKEIGNMFDPEISEVDSAAARSAASVESELRESLPVATGFALPLEMISEICTDEAIPSVVGYEPSFGNEQAGWLDIRIAVAIIGDDIELELSGDKGQRILTLHVESADALPSVALAWRLEKSGLLAQAASMWMALQTNGMEAKKVALHLKRIKSKLLEK